MKKTWICFLLFCSCITPSESDLFIIDYLTALPTKNAEQLQRSHVLLRIKNLPENYAKIQVWADDTYVGWFDINKPIIVPFLKEKGVQVGYVMYDENKKVLQSKKVIWVDKMDKTKPH